jgi:hypothetical protein
MVGFDVVWQRIVALQGQAFRQRRGKPFTYVVSGGCVVPSTTNRLLPRSQFARAFERAPLGGPGQLQDLQGPSYLFAILTDPRVATAGALPQHEGEAQNLDVRGGQAGRAGPGMLASPGSTGISSSSAAVRISDSRQTVTGAGALSLAALRDVDPHGALVVVACSAGKAPGGRMPVTASTVGLWPDALLEARARVLASAAADMSAVLPAWRRYTGTFYQNAGHALADAATTGHLVIISGGYGLVGAEEPIGWYNKQLRLSDWPPGVLESSLIGAAHHAGAQRVVAFAAATTQYATLLRRAPWRDAGITAYLVTVAGVSRGALAEVPRRLGEAFGVFWNAQDRRYPSGIVLENLS